jgi:predicted glycosyltransferase
MTHSLPESNGSVYTLHTDLSAICRLVWYGRRVRVWIDISNSPQVPFFRPLIALLRERGHEVSVTTREYAQTTDLLALHAIDHDVVGPRHGGAGAVGKARAMAGRLRALRGYARGRGFDVAFSHASHELPLAARSLGIPSAYAFDYEFARVQHGFGCRAARRVVVPDVIPQDRLDRLGARASKVRRFPGLEEEYYLHAFTAEPGVLDVLGVERDRTIVVVRTPPDVSLYHRAANPLFGDVLERIGRDHAVQAVVLPRTAKQRAEIAARALPSILVPERAVDAQSLVALSDLVVSAGGTMNREAVALGVPAYTTFAGRMGAVDTALVNEGRLRVLTAAEDLQLEKRNAAGTRTERDPALLLDLMLAALER